MSEVASQTLEAVAREITQALNEARAALETHVEQPDNPALLERCATELHLVQGVLRVLEIYGAALLAEEMGQVVRYLQGIAAEKKNQAEALDALMRSMVQLPGYLERVLAGGRDLALVLLPLLNDMRAVRGSSLLSEGTLLLLNLKSDKQADPVAPNAGEEGMAVEQWARRLRARFQVGLIGWIRGERIDQNLDILAAVAAKLEQVATQQPAFQLWWVTGAVIEALRERGLDGGVSVKRLLGLADREIRRLYEQNEGRYSQSPPVELLNNLLYYVARSNSNGPRVNAVRASFKLAELLPVDDSIEQERENLSAPSVKLMHTVAAAIREDLAKIKDVLDIFVRRGAGSPEELLPQVDLLRKIGDTLGVLGLGELRGRVQGEIARLEDLIAKRERPADATLVQIAATLIGVEDRLDDQLVGMIMPKRRDVGHDAAPVDIDFQHVQAAVLRECVVNLARVKEYVAQNVGGTLDAAGFDNWQDLVRGMQAGLLMLGKARAVEVIERITGQLRRVMQPGGSSLSTEGLDRLADSIVSTEYYMETLQAGRSDPWYMLDNALASLDALEAEPLRAVPTVSPVAPLTPESFARTVLLDRAAPPPGVDVALTGRNPLVAPPTLSQTSIARIEPQDPELLQLFMEEAQEEVAKIEQYFPQWDQNPVDEDALVTVRRSFHTLKGSGRMVGARELAEFSWGIENLVNRLLDKTLTRSPAILGTLRDAVRALPELVVHLGGGAAPRTDLTAIVTRAHALASGRSGDAPVVAKSVSPQRSVVQPPPPPPAPLPDAPVDLLDVFAAATEAGGDGALPGDALAQLEAQAHNDRTEPDIALRDIYARETDSHVSAVRSWLAREVQMPAPHLLTEVVYRACHTLSGSSKMAEARHGIRLAEPLNHWLRKSFDSGVGLSDADLALVGDCMQAMEGVSRNLDESSGFFFFNDGLRERIQQAELELDRRIAASQASTESGPDSFAPDPGSPDIVAPEPAAPAADDGNVQIDYDPEIAGIFSEEATELLESAQAALAAFGSSPSDPDTQMALKRPLHTLKGGARMAGVVAMGDLAHELETLVMHIEMGVVPADSHSQAVAQAALDELARMRELITLGRAVGPAREVIARIQALAGGAPDGVAVAGLPERWESIEEQPAPAAAAIVAAPLVPPGREPVAAVDRPEMARVDAELLNQLLNNAGEVSIGRSRVEQQVGSIEFNLGELSRTVTRLKEQLRKLEIETEAQILHRHETESAHRGDFDPLELDRYSSIQQFSRALAETANDVASIQQLLESLTQETQNLLQQQGRTITEVQNGLMRTRMVSFQRHVQRLSRIVRQAAADTDKQAELVVEGATGELDRQVLERMLPPFEHMLRNAVVHGIESRGERHAKGKPETGQIRLTLRREGAEVIVEIADDGAGMNLKAIRDKGVTLGLIQPGQTLSDEDAMQLVLEPGFSTAGSVTQAAGRGVGMDVVATEIKKLGGALHMETVSNPGPAQGTKFTIRLPFTLAVSHALVVRIGEEHYALPLPTVEGVVRLSRAEILQHLGADAPSFIYGGQKFRFQNLGLFVGLESSPLPEQDVTIPVVLVRAGEHSTGLVTDELIGSREIVVKPVGPQIAAIRGISGATILGDGKIVIILDIGALVRAEWRGRPQTLVPREKQDRRTFALVVDDSITVRRVTQRLLERNGMRVLTARDGMDAVSLLQENTPDIILLDIEMPRMDGYEVAAHVRSDERLKDIPIIMITSRVGEKHRARAIELGVNDYLGKPYQESQLLDAIEPLVARRQQQIAASRN
jgi:chemosensory pili system protein ChpA (sensor histidine kinase/response regulator)